MIKQIKKHDHILLNEWHYIISEKYLTYNVNAYGDVSIKYSLKFDDICFVNESNISPSVSLDDLNAALGKLKFVSKKDFECLR